MLTFRDSSGNILFDLSEPLAKFLGEATIGTTSATSGTITDSRFTLAEPFAFVVTDDATWEHGTDPVVTVSGTTLSWEYPAGVTPFPTKIVYGVL